MELMIKQIKVVPYQGGVCSELSLQHREVPAVAHPNGGWGGQLRWLQVPGSPELTQQPSHCVLHENGKITGVEVNLKC